MPSATVYRPSRVWTTRAFEQVKGTVAALVVDDDEELAQALAAVLEMEGFKVRVSDCVHCLEIITQWRPSVVVLDIEMPIKNGFCVAIELRETSQCARIPIIAYTSLPENDVRSRGVSAGMDAYCRKGNAPDCLIDLLSVVAPSG